MNVPRKAIPVGFTATSEQIDLWHTLQAKRKALIAAVNADASFTAYHRWISSLPIAQLRDLSTMNAWEMLYGTRALDAMLTGMRRSIDESV